MRNLSSIATTIVHQLQYRIVVLLLENFGEWTALSTSGFKDVGTVLWCATWQVVLLFSNLFQVYR